MDADGAVKHGFGRARFHGDSKALDDFTRIGADHVQADHAVRGVFNQQLHEGALGAAAQGVFQRFELAFEDGNTVKFTTKRLARISFRITHGTDVGVGEYCCGDELVAHAAGGFASGWAEQVVNQHHRLTQRHRGELHPRCHIAQGVDAGDTGLVVGIHRDGALFALRHTYGF